jgi:hypothetical protein
MKSKLNLKTLGACIIGSLAFVGFVSAWAVTASKAENTDKKVEKAEIKLDKVDEKVTDLEKAMIQQVAQTTAQQTMNETLIKILEKKK